MSDSTTNPSQNRDTESPLIRESKKEAKRLLRLAQKNEGLLSVATLSSAQEVIAVLKGKQSWHELTARNKPFLSELAIPHPEGRGTIHFLDGPDMSADIIVSLMEKAGGNYVFVTRGRHGITGAHPSPLPVPSGEPFHGMTGLEVSTFLQEHFTKPVSNHSERGRGLLMARLLYHFSKGDNAAAAPSTFRLSLSSLDGLNPVQLLKVNMLASAGEFIRHLFEFSGTVTSMGGDMWNNLALIYFEPIIAQYWESDDKLDLVKIKEAMSEEAMLDRMRASGKYKDLHLLLEDEGFLAWREQFRYFAQHFTDAGFDIMHAVMQEDMDWILTHLNAEIEILESFLQVDTDTLEALLGGMNREVFLPPLCRTQFMGAYLKMLEIQIASIGNEKTIPTALIIDHSIQMDMDTMRRLFQLSRLKQISLYVLSSRT